MPTDVPVRRVEVTFVGTPPTSRVRQASGVSDVEVDGFTMRCHVHGSFQPFLEALRGHEVTDLRSTDSIAATILADECLRAETEWLSTS